MAIQVGGTTVVSNTRGLNNIASVDATTVTTLSNAGVGASPFQYDTVSGTTQALDVGSHNFFDAGTLTADTTVSFSNVPTEARWTYTAETGTTGYELENATYVRDISVKSLEDVPLGLFFKPDGTVMYITGFDRIIYEYSLSTAWDITTASYVRGFNVGSQETYPSGIFFKADGTKMYMCGFAADYVNEYSLSTAWNISTTSYVRRFSVASQGVNPKGVFFKPDGTVMYVASQDSAVWEYSLSTAWNVSTASYVRTLDTTAQETDVCGVSVKSDGTALFIIGANDTVFEYSLSTAWNVSTASYVKGFSVADYETNAQDLFFTPDGTDMYITGSLGDRVVQYQTAGATPISFPSSVQNPPTETLSGGAQVSYTFFTADGGTTVKLINEEVL